MKKQLFVVIALIIISSMILAACGAPAATATPQVIEKTVVQTQIVEVTPPPAANPEAVIQGVEPNAEITFWTFYLSPTFDDYIKNTIARFNEAYPDVKVNWEDHQATFQDDLRNAFAAGNAPDVINLSVSEGWVSDYATQGLLLPLDDKVPQEIKDMYFEGLWKEQLVDGVNYQFPWYQGINVNLINTQVYQGVPQVDADGKITGYTGGAGLKVEDFPKTIDGLPALCKTIKEKTGTLCDIRLTVNDLLAQMVYEGGVKVMSEDGKSFTFDSPEAVDWLNMYVGMVKDGTVDKTVLVTDQDRIGLDLFTSGKAAFYATGPNLIRDVRANNPGLYGYLAVVPSPVGKSGVIGKGLMSISVKKDTKYPNASIALAQFFTNPKSMLEFSKIVSVYPSTPASYDDPFFSAKPVAIEDSAKPYAKDAISKYADIVPTIPHKADVNQIVLDAVQQALFNGVDAQQALSDAVAKANALLP
ncbi:MAG TPA: sugar ABC transporter substrate-binding protein [Anaerolineales bacterium]|nr:sugar ABC transporter substrate-binding protein [Anaerolineales bacterium]HLO33827.1 sugar ABC transporter substrate-binding protein [Anaerolineales bacterium]